MNVCLRPVLRQVLRPVVRNMLPPGGQDVAPVLSGLVDGLSQEPPVVLLDSSAAGTLTWDFHSSGTPPEKGAGDIGTGIANVVEGANEIEVDFSAYVGLTGYPHLRVTSGGVDSNVLTLKQITVYSPWLSSAFSVDLSDAGRLYLTEAMATNVSAYGDPVGGVASRAGPNLIQPVAYRRPRWTRHPQSGVRNLLDGSDGYAGGTVATSAVEYTIFTADAVTITLSGASTAGPLVGPGALTFTPAAGTLTITMSAAGDVQLERGASATAYQSRVSLYNITEAGSPDCNGLTYDGTNDVLQTATALDLTATNAITICAGVRKASDAAVGRIAEHKTSAPRFILLAPESNAQATYGLLVQGAGGSSSRATTIGPHAAPVASILTGTADISADETHLRVDGALAASDTTTNIGTGNFGSDVLDVGMRSVSDATPFSGTIYELHIFPSVLTGSDLAITEQWVAAKTAGGSLT